MKINKQKNYAIYNIIIILTGVITRIVYVFYTSVGERQHDLGYATLLTDSNVNPGHLGYVEYIAKFHHLPDFDPFSMFSYYHPPLHHIIASIFVNIAYALGIREPKVYEVIQLPVFIYSCLTVLIGYAILRMLCKNEKYIAIPLALLCFHPGLIYMTGSINNDMLALLFYFLCVYTTLLWIKNDHNNRYLYLMALSIGFGLIAKPNVGILAIPMGIVMLMHLFDCKKEGKLMACIKKYAIFALLSVPVGLSWTIRNIIRFGTKPGIPSPSANQYIGSYSFLSNFGFPQKLSIAFPFYSENATYNNNAWSIMFKTSLFTEIWPVDISSPALLACQIIYILAVIAAIICAVLCFIRPIWRIKQGDKELGIFLLISYATILITFVLFVLKYPYTCSCNFRYVAISLLFSSIALLPVSKDTTLHK